MWKTVVGPEANITKGEGWNYRYKLRSLRKDGGEEEEEWDGVKESWEKEWLTQELI